MTPIEDLQVLIEYKEEIDRMISLYRYQQYTLAEQLRDQLAEQLDDIMRL